MSEKTIATYQDGFTSTLANLDDIWGKTTGASIGRFNPSSMAEDYLNLEPHTDEVSLYCLRRFGNPDRRLHDNYKQIAEWIITTPHPEVWLTVQLGGGGAFGYLLTKELDHNVLEEQTLPQREWGNEFRQWAKDTHGVILYFPFGWACDLAKTELDKLFDEWGVSNYEGWAGFETMPDFLATLGLPEGYDPEKEGGKIWDSFCGEKRKEYETLFKEYKIINPLAWDDTAKHPIYHPGKLEMSLRRVSRWLRRHRMAWLSGQVLKIQMVEQKKRKAEIYKKVFWNGLQKYSDVREVNEALYRTLQDLMRPVELRDCELYITREGFEHIQWRDWGEDDYADAPIYDYFAPYMRRVIKDE